MAGDCYERNGTLITDLLISFLRDMSPLSHCSDPMLVHGLVVGEGSIEGVEHGHCWIEDGDVVYDFSNGRTLIHRKSEYYRLGRIRDEADRLYRYTPEEVRRKILDFEHWGPRDLESEF